ncbi:immunoglobulin kappa light chain-like [Nematolebias whitei]|uniref:immunoglobulin kappa light chain-like n=1 Tax=Nematolebias whitei TaxID=451745 RepID=UPI00189A2984|nr:immunoglobulin kappa light chain-like [Nematolebias whitei]
MERDEGGDSRVLPTCIGSGSDSGDEEVLVLLFSVDRKNMLRIMDEFSYLTSASSVHQHNRFVSAHVGDNVTLGCSYEGGDSAWICWYIQPLGHRPRIIASVFVYSPDAVFYDGFKNNPRFSLVRENQTSQLIILHLNVLDSATYYCVLNVAQVVSFAEGTTLSVKGPGSTVQPVVHQSVSETMQPGGSVTLNCTVQTGSCDGEHRIYWFRTAGKSYPGLVYTQGHRHDQCERNPNEQTHTCVYNLPMKNLNVSHAGTYYCAVVSCGHILFGNGTALDFSCEEGSRMNPLIFLMAGSLTTVLVVLLTFSTYKLTKKLCSHNSASTGDNNQDLDSLYYASIHVRESIGTKRQKSSRNDTVYSRVSYKTPSSLFI